MPDAISCTHGMRLSFSAALISGWDLMPWPRHQHSIHWWHVVHRLHHRIGYSIPMFSGFIIMFLATLSKDYFPPFMIPLRS